MHHHVVSDACATASLICMSINRRRVKFGVCVYFVACCAGLDTVLYIYIYTLNVHTHSQTHTCVACAPERCSRLSNCSSTHTRDMMTDVSATTTTTTSTVAAAAAQNMHMYSRTRTRVMCAGMFRYCAIKYVYRNISRVPQPRDQQARRFGRRRTASAPHTHTRTIIIGSIFGVCVCRVHARHVSFLRVLFARLCANAVLNTFNIFNCVLDDAVISMAI